MILAIGNINVDIICSLPRLPIADDKLIASNIIFAPGGAACNFAVGLARLNSKAAVHGYVGDDIFGLRTVESLVNENVNTSRIIKKQNYHTGFVLILIDKNGQSIKIGYREANAFLSPQNITPELFEGVEFVHVSSVSPEVALKVAEIATKLSIRTSIDFGAEFLTQPQMVLKEVIKNYSIIFMNRLGFQKTYNKKPTKKNIQKIENNQNGILNITLGEKGSIILTPEETIHIPIWKVKVIDTTGAGDAYAAGFVHFYMEKLPLYEIGIKAAACAAMQISISNARDGLPTINKVDEFINSYK